MAGVNVPDRSPVIADLILDAVEDLVLLFEQDDDGTHRCVTASGSWLRRAGRRQEEVSGRRADELFTDDAVERLAAAAVATSESGAPATYTEAVRFGATEVPVAVTVKIASTAAGEHAGDYILWAGRDVTRQLELERVAEEASSELARSNRALAAFTSAASHDMQEPLRMVASYVELLDARYGDQLDERARTYMAFAVDGARRMQDMVDSLLAYGRVRATPPRREPVDVGKVAGAALRDLGELVREHGAAVEVGELPVVVSDPNDLARVLRNLIANSLRFSTEAPALVRISAERAACSWVVHVDDNGVGIPAPDRTRVFEMFTRLQRSSATTGTGMGLAMCREIVERHGGSISADASPLGGTRISFTLPDHVTEMR